MQSTRRLAFRSLVASSPISDEIAGGIRLLDTKQFATVTASSLNAVTSLSRHFTKDRYSTESDIFDFYSTCTAVLKGVARKQCTSRAQ